MKQYVRRNSRNQTVSANKVDQQRHDDDRGPASDSGTQLTADSRALVHKQGSPDPYSFDCEDKLVKDNDCPALSGGAKAPRQTAAQVSLVAAMPQCLHHANFIHMFVESTCIWCCDRQKGAADTTRTQLHAILPGFCQAMPTLQLLAH